MNHPIRASVPVAAIVVALALFVALPAAAHPGIGGGEAPVDSRASLTLHIAHGCLTDGADDHGAEGGQDQADEASGEPTTEVALEVPQEVRIIDVPEVEGYRVGLEHGDDGRVEVVTWTATDGGEPAPSFPFDAVVSGEEGAEIHLKVFQGCGEFTYRWVGTPDEPADDPAVRLRLVAADPDNPPPEPTTESTPDPDVPDAPDEPGDAPDTDEPGRDTAEDEDVAETPAADEEVAQDDADVAAEASAQGGGGASQLLLGLVVLAVLVVGAVILIQARKRRGGTSDA